MIAIDLGSNTIRFIEYNCKNKKWGKSYEAVVKTADGLFATNKINKQAVKRVILAIQEAKSRLDFSKNKIFAVATAAMRLANNAADVLSEIWYQTGVKFDIISGKDEAKYTVYAAQKRLANLHVESQAFVLVDIGGGSTEITFVQNQHSITKSFNIGIVTVAQQINTLSTLEILPKRMLADVTQYINEYYVHNARPEIFVQTAGTPTTMAAYLQGMKYDNYDSTKINGFVLRYDLLDKVKDELLCMDKQTRAIYVGVGREDLIITGIEIVKNIYDILGYKESVVIDDSLREGLALYYCSKLT